MSELTNENLYRLSHNKHPEDVSSRRIRVMAAELLKLRGLVESAVDNYEIDSVDVNKDLNDLREYIGKVS